MSKDRGLEDEKLDARRQKCDLRLQNTKVQWSDPQHHVITRVGQKFPKESDSEQDKVCWDDDMMLETWRIDFLCS